MAPRNPSPDSLQASWKVVDRAAARLRERHLRDLFAEDPDRFRKLSFRLDDLLVDFSRERLDSEALSDLVSLASAAGVEARRDAMFDGAEVNETEGRAALHTALRANRRDDAPRRLPEAPAQIRQSLERFLAFAESVRTGETHTLDGRTFAHVVNLGTGGSDLGPAMAVQALAPWHDGPRTEFVSNVDGAHLADVLKRLDPERTLFVVASRTFTTAETLTNARSAVAWLTASLGDRAAGAHLAAVTANPRKAATLGIDGSRTFEFWDWVGGRYSVWSSVGLPLAVAVGADRFREFLAGARAMDRHFCEAPLSRNLPVLMALVGIWRRNAMGWPTVALVPYDQRLARLPAYVQQLETESNGKRVGLDGAAAARPTAPVVWGEPGTNAQHSFFQLIHQGTDTIPVDFLLAARPQEPPGEHHPQLIANALAQSAALAFGRTETQVRAETAAEGHPADRVERLVPHRVFPGNRPSTTLIYRRLDPSTLGRLIALYEHKVFVQAAIWGINAFDQWGVELGKSLAARILPAVEGGDPGLELDPATSGLLAHLSDFGPADG